MYVGRNSLAQEISERLETNLVRVAEQWSEEISCPEGIHNSFNIGTKINGAYTPGLALRTGGFHKDHRYRHTRAGQDSDYNPASAAGILGTMIGYSNIPESWKEALYEVEDIPFSNTDISLNKAYDMTQTCQRDVAEAWKREGRTDFIIRRRTSDLLLGSSF